VISEEVGYWGTAAMACARTFTAHVGHVLDRYGSPAIHERYLKPMLAGQKIACQGMTEPAVGSNVAGARTRLTRDGAGYVLTGQKRFVDGAQTADFILAAARLGEHDDPRADFVAVCVDTRDPGFLIREVQCDWHGFRGMGSSWIEFRNIRVKPEQIVGRPGQGWQILMDELLVERVVMSRAQLGGARRALTIASNYAEHRESFDRTLKGQPVIGFKVAECAAKLDAAYLLNDRAAALLDRGLGRAATMDVAMAKLLGTEYAWQVADEAIQIIGGMGYTTKYPVERIQRDLRAARAHRRQLRDDEAPDPARALPRLHDPDFRDEFVSNELGGSPVWGEALAADDAFHPSRQTVLTPSRPKYVPSERPDGPERP
jgi:alkylation response protein AidB-like acyl-CoA dehydrogenase